jgi:hypothetical protein
MALYTEQQLRLKADFRNEEGILIDPGAVTLKIELPDKTVVEVGTIKDSTGKFHGLFTPTLAGTHYARWKGTAPLETALEESFYVTASYFTSRTGNLVTLEQFKRFKGIEASDHDRDESIEDAIAFMSEAIRKYTDRSFGLQTNSGVRVFDFDDSGYIDIDDATKIEGVEIAIGSLVTPIQSYAWRAEPVKGPIFDYLVIPHWAGVYSPEMGFTFNLDVVSKERGWPGVPPTVLVKGTWGWTEIPPDVQAACLIAVANYADNPDENVSESIENYSYSRGGSRIYGATESVAIPGRARDLLSPYVRFMI